MHAVAAVVPCFLAHRKMFTMSHLVLGQNISCKVISVMALIHMKTAAWRLLCELAFLAVRRGRTIASSYRHYWCRKRQEIVAWCRWSYMFLLVLSLGCVLLGCSESSVWKRLQKTKTAIWGSFNCISRYELIPEQGNRIKVKCYMALSTCKCKVLKVRLNSGLTCLMSEP